MGFDRIFRGLTCAAAVAVLAAGASASAKAQTAPPTVPQIVPVRSTAVLTAPTLSRPVALGVTWPKISEVERLDGNGVSLYGGVASIDGSDQYGLSVLTFDPFLSSVRATYIDAWALTAPNPASCSLTFRAVERTMTQQQANALAPELATAELQTIQKDHPDLVKAGDRTREGSDVTRVVDRFSWGGTDGATKFDGLSKSWVFVRLGRAYYVNKICLSQTGPSDLVVMDQLIGLNYRTGDAPTPTPGDTVPENPPSSQSRVSLPPPVGNIAARAQDQQALESQTLGAEPAPVPAPDPAPAPVEAAPMAMVMPAKPAPEPVAPTPTPPPAVVPAPAAPTFAASPTAPAPAPTPAPTPNASAAHSLTQSLNAGPPAN